MNQTSSSISVNLTPSQVNENTKKDSKIKENSKILVNLIKNILK